MEPKSREEILASTLAYEDIVVPAWGRTVRVREMSLLERSSFEIAVYNGRANGIRLRSELLVRVCTDPATGERLFLDDDTEALGATGAKAVQVLFAPALRLSGLTEEEAEELGKG
ncbi:MAG: hypothetical protein EPN53_00990 [Acidobacteria bacterium]|nr:MAG: hypothetical protein EPN53_00990 [Acidobacteriota bacterium]